MPTVEWKVEFALGHHIIDEQHKTLVELLQRLEAALGRSDDQKALLKAFMEIHRYACYHFDDEEELMNVVDFDTWHAHRFEHQHFLARVESMATEFQARRAAIGPDTLDFLVNWHLEHISKSDRELVGSLVNPKHKTVPV